MSVGHVARAIEERDIPTTAIYVKAFRHVVEEMRLARTVTTRHPMGRPLGSVGDPDRHRQVVAAALGLIDSATQPTIVDLPEPFLRSRE